MAKVGSGIRSELLLVAVTDEIRQESLPTMMFAYDIVMCSESRWGYALERRGMKLSGSKTEYM